MVVSFVEEFLASIWSSTPKHLIFEVALIIAIFILLTQKPREIIKNDDELTQAEEDSIIDAWHPEPIVPELPDDYDLSVLNSKTVTSAPTDKITVEGKEALNFAVPNFFGLNNNKELLDAAQKAIDHYAVGACGPRQFYGTMDAHLDVEEAVARWTGVEDSVNYCFPFATTTSVIQAFAHNTDVVFIDEYCWFAIKVGTDLTRGKVVVYKHNDMGDLRDKIIKTKNSFERWDRCNRWVVAEGISTNDGTVIDLPTLIKLRHEFCLRIILDETLSFGALGKTGRGACEHFDIDRSEIEISIGSYGPALASLGGFTISTKDLCNHQRLSSHAYIFSASPPPYAVICARRAVEIVEKDGAERIATLRANVSMMHQELADIKGLEIVSDILSPIVHLRLGKEMSFKETNETLQKICDAALNDATTPTFIVKSKFTLNRDSNKARPTIKVHVSPAHSQEQIKAAAEAIKRAAASIL